ncbi:diphthamide biosynthesis enzyme Dph2 [Thermogymnomonas acidicola]|uniref:diphthamide biosynthesis enzyme Dph2 n=1 Tax=Thermogymnomonas acidicola TaxID=399579 RepID=UPI0009462C61|nr:diphthamide biosynthesis enzyme Dph2 [Thermogymnomonas acidicola]
MVSASNVQEAIQRAKDLGASKVLLQLPDGLKPRAFGIFSELSKHFSVVISSQSFYGGACDVGGSMDTYSRVDCIVQLGHTEIPNLRYPKPIIFIEHLYERDARIEASAFQILRSRGGYSTVGLAFSVQYRQVAEGVREALEALGLRVLVGGVDGRMKYPGQVLGCNFSAIHSVQAMVDSIVVVSTGTFHALGAQLSTEKEVFIYDVSEGSLRSMREEADRFLRQRFAAISRAAGARKVCIVIDTKIGQYRPSLAAVVERQARESGKEVVTLATDEANPPRDYENLMCDAVVFTGCPRVPIDDGGKFSMPVLTPQEFQMALGGIKKGRYVLDEIVAVDTQ